MTLASDNKTKPKEKDPTKSLFIWLDILGFSEALENEDRYSELYKILKKFQDKFKIVDCETKIISDGIVLFIENFTSNSLDKIFQDIANKQLAFTIETRYFIRGGISLGTKYNTESHSAMEKNDSLLISNGLSRAVKIESSLVNWPIIGIPQEGLDDLKSSIEARDGDDLSLNKCYNKHGKKIYFIDFIKEENDAYIELIYDKIDEFKGNKYYEIRNKYIWLLRYYLHACNEVKVRDSLKGIIL